MAKRIHIFNDEAFLKFINWVEIFVAKVLSIALVVVIFAALFDLAIVLFRSLLEPKLMGSFNKTLIELFGLFLNVLIALELLENITAYFKKHVIQVELVVVTALIAVARKIIVFDVDKLPKSDLIPLAIAGLALSVSYWLLRNASVYRRRRRRITSSLKDKEKH